MTIVVTLACGHTVPFVTAIPSQWYCAHCRKTEKVVKI